jgi:phage terminase small subunit
MLKGKRLKFARAYLKDQDATKSALKAGYSKKSSHVEGYRLLKNDEIMLYIKQRSEKIADIENLTIAKVLQNIETILQRCLVKGSKFNPNAALKAIEMQAKFLQMFAEKKSLEPANGNYGTIEVPGMMDSEKWDKIQTEIN